MEDETRIALAQSEENECTCLHFLSNIHVTMVLYTNKLTMPVRRMYRSTPKNFTDKYPKNPNPDVRTTIQPISLGFSTPNGPISWSGRKGRINKANTTKRIRAYISSPVISPMMVCSFTLEDSNTMMITV